MDEQRDEKNLSIGRNLKIGFFHLGSGMADVLATGVWNRIMISDLGFAATPVSILASLRYFLAPLGVWAGRLSDERTFFGFRRLFWVWLGRLMMVLGIFMLGFTTAALANDVDAGLEPQATPLMWGLLAAALLLFGLGNALSGSTFLALIYDRAREDQRGRAVGIVWTFLLLGFTVAGIFFGIMLPSREATELGEEAAGVLNFAPEVLQTLFIVTALVLGTLWFFSLLGEEKRTRQNYTSETGDDSAQTSLRADLKLAWSNRATRFFFWYLALSMIFAFAQDPILEPFGGDVFNMEARITTRFAAYWGSMSILGTVAFLFLSRRYKRLTNTAMSWIGVLVLVLTFALFAVSAFGGIRWLVTPALITLGIGLGVWNVGTLGLMMDMSPFGRAGTFLGFWTLVVTFGRGLGVSGGGIIRDTVLNITGNAQIAYGSVFVLEVVGLLVALWALRQVNAKAFIQQETRDATAVLAGSLD
ncbi:MAG: MFS transporter [Chloroflexi bacterium]|nr:MAG: MFS transporter [Chloroflexota bacterium]